MKKILFLFLFLPVFAFSQKQNSGLITCNLQVKVAQDTTTQVWNLVNSYTTAWQTALEMQPDRNAQNTWQLSPWLSITNTLPQSTELPYFMHSAIQTRSNFFEGLLEVRDKVCVYLFTK